MIKVEKLNQKWFDEIKSISKETTGFTEVNDYILWMLEKTQDPFCKVLINDNKLVAYLLALYSFMDNEIFIWQLGINKRIKNKPTMLFEVCESLLDEMKQQNIFKIKFTATQESIKLINYLTKNLLGNNPSLIEEASSGRENYFLIKTERT